MLGFGHTYLRPRFKQARTYNERHAPKLEEIIFIVLEWITVQNIVSLRDDDAYIVVDSCILLAL